MKIELWKTYKTRDGKTAKVIEVYENGGIAVKYENGLRMDIWDNGRVRLQTDDPFDLIEELPTVEGASHVN
jgi:hypothetical protein